MKTAATATFILLSTITVTNPDPKLTPGVVLPVTVKKICVSGYSDTVRHTTPATKKQVAARYNIAYAPAKYEIDHLISLELGGADVIENLWPQPWDEARKKDVVETWLKREICAGRRGIRRAQREIRGDKWPLIYNEIKMRKRKR